MKRKISRLDSSTGLGILEAVIAVSIFLLFFLLHINSYSQADKARKAQAELQNRMRVFQGMINIIGMPTALRATAYKAGDTSDLGNCVFGRHGTCPNPTLIRDLVLLLPPLSSNGASVALSGAFTGTPDSPMFYSNEGDACDISVEPCPVEDYPIAVSTQWQAICPPRADVTYTWPNTAWVASDGTNHMYPEGVVIPNWCSRAHYIKIYYRFYPRDGAQQFKPVAGTIMVNGPSANFNF